MAESSIDLRSDTVTRPTPGMRAAMSAAEVGDDVFGEDPTVNRLQERLAHLLGKDAALFVPSGTMSNQICVKIHTQPGDELLCEANCHIYNFEAGGPAVLSGVTCRTLEGDYGVLDVSQLDDKVRPVNDHLVRTRLVCLENTHNRGGGRVYPLEKLQAISGWAHGQGLAVHLDGARLWNAVVATGIPAAEWARHCDSVSVCFSKGLGAPVGSAVVGSAEMIETARRNRKLFGGGMRQAGIIAAGALHAVRHHIDRLADDHRNARELADGLAGCSRLQLDPEQVETNIVFAAVPEGEDARGLVGEMADAGVLCADLSPRTIRFVTHLDAGEEAVSAAVERLRPLLR